VQGLSKAFVTVAIGDLAEMREWRAATSTMITYGLAVSEAWASSYHDRAQDGLTQATVAATTDDDREALALLKNEFDTLAGWSGATLAARQALNGAQTIDPNTLQNDQTLAKINNCGEFLSAMLLSGAFNDNASCH
jgi:conjugal transfer/entry exclusion protein